MSIELRILGALEVVAEGRPLALGGRKQRALLALLALHANELIPSDRLLEEIWPDSEPGAATPSLHVYISQLRKALGDSAGAIQTRSGGYVLTLEPDQLDAFRFERLLRQGRRAFAAGDPEQARATLTEALSLWRGPALADLTYESFAERESERLEELRLEAIEEKLEAELQLGRHIELVSELEEIVTTEPLRERLRAQLMLALYRSGRQAEALESYREGRRALVDELGLEPSPELKELEAAILRQDSSLAVEPPELRVRRHLPAPATPLIGRRREVEEVVSLLRGGTRLLTLTGAGGTGKTRLGLQAAYELAEHFRDGVYFVGLAPVHDPGLVLATIAGALGIRGAAPRPFVDSLKEHLRSRRLLLVLDNFEHVDEAAPVVSELLAEASGLKVLVTSRTGLRLYGEHEYPVPPLTEEEGLELFAARAQAARPGFALDGARAQVAELVRRLDGLPLAIELAAARSSELSPEQMLGFLTNRLELVTQGPRDVAARQQTLRATIEWSYGLLDAAELTLFARLGVFAGGCTLAAAEEVCAADLETLASLVDKSLVREQEGPDGEPRFEMLETIREYAAGRLEDLGEAEELRRRHAQHFLALAEEAEPNLRVGSPNEWFDRLEREHDNLRAALDRLEASGENELALRLAGAVWGFWSMTDHLVEGRRRLESALCSDERPTAARAKALNGAADLAVGCGDPVAARRRAEEALALHRKLGDAWGAALSLLLLGHAAREEGDLARAQQLFEESARRFRELGDEHYTHSATRGLAWTCAKVGDRARARALYEDDLRRARATSNKRIEAYSLSALAMMAVDEGRAEDAVPMLKETDRISRELGDYLLQTAVNFCRSANALAFAGRAGAAARLLSWAEAQHEELGASVLTWLAEINEQTLATVRTQLDEAAFSEAWQQGRRMTVDEAFALALDL